MAVIPRERAMPNLTRLLVLWLLSEHALHGYQIKRIISDPGLQLWFPIEFASIYSVLRFLEKAGYAEKARTEREGRRPARRRYAITGYGRRYFAALLQEALRRPPQLGQPVDVALAATGELSEHDVATLLAARREALADRLRRLSRIERAAPAREMIERARAVTRGELEWLNAMETPRKSFSEGPRTGERGRRPMAGQDQPEIQLIANLVVTTSARKVLFVQYDSDGGRWWLPGADLHPYEHPDEAARRVLASLPGLSVQAIRMHGVESFRGRRGWHVVFHYRVDAAGDPDARVPAKWFRSSDLPRTMHGQWERNVVQRVLEIRGNGSP